MNFWSPQEWLWETLAFCHINVKKHIVRSTCCRFTTARWGSFCVSEVPFWCIWGFCFRIVSKVTKKTHFRAPCAKQTQCSQCSCILSAKLRSKTATPTSRFRRAEYRSKLKDPMVENTPSTHMCFACLSKIKRLKRLFVFDQRVQKAVRLWGYGSRVCLGWSYQTNLGQTIEKSVLNSRASNSLDHILKALFIFILCGGTWSYCDRMGKGWKGYLPMALENFDSSGSFAAAAHVPLLVEVDLHALFGRISQEVAQEMRLCQQVAGQREKIWGTGQQPQLHQVPTGDAIEIREIKRLQRSQHILHHIATVRSVLHEWIICRHTHRSRVPKRLAIQLLVRANLMVLQFSTASENLASRFTKEFRHFMFLVHIQNHLPISSLYWTVFPHFGSPYSPGRSPRAPRPSAASHRERCAPRAGTRLRQGCVVFWCFGFFSKSLDDCIACEMATLVIQKWEMCRPKTWPVHLWFGLTFSSISWCEMHRV